MYAKLNVWSLALTSGILMGAGLFFITWWIILFDGTASGPIWISRIYRGYSVTPLGSMIGMVWGFCDWFIGGLVFAWLYNKIAKAK